MKKIALSMVAISSMLFGEIVSAGEMGPISTDKSKKWIGFYVGGNIGDAWASSKWTYQNTNPYDAVNPTSPIILSGNQFSMSNLSGGAQIGFNYQLRNFVFGPEVDFLWTNLARTQATPTAPLIFSGSTQTVNTKTNSFVTATGRAGILVKSNWLVYGRGGYANTVIHTKGDTSPPRGSLSLNWNTANHHDGWVAGAGIEYRFIQNLSIGFEYNYIGFNNEIHTGAVSGGVIGPNNQIVHQVNANIQNIMARINILLGS